MVLESIGFQTPLTALYRTTRLARPARAAAGRLRAGLQGSGFPMPRTKKPLGMFRKAQTSAKPKQRTGLGALPEWNLEDLYPSMDSPAFASDLAKAAAECKSLQRRV